MDDVLERKPARASDDRMAKRNRAPARDLTKRREPGSLLDRAGHALRDQEPPRDDVAIQRVDDRFDSLIEKVALDNVGIHLRCGLAWLNGHTKSNHDAERDAVNSYELRDTSEWLSRQTDSSLAHERPCGMRFSQRAALSGPSYL